METIKRRFNAINHTVVAYCLAVVAAIYVLTSTTFADAVLNFCLGGIVPGTNIVLEPDVLIMAVAVILGLSLAGALVALLQRMVSLRHFREMSDEPADEEVVIYDGKQERRTSGRTKPVSSPKQPKKVATRPSAPVTQAVTTRRHTTARQHVTAGLLRGERAINHVIDQVLRLNILSRIGVFLSSSLAVVIRELRATWKLLALVVSKISWFVVKCVWRLLAISIVTWQTISRLLRRAASSTWKHLQPHAYRFDTWLELQCRTVLRRLHRKLQNLEFFQMVEILFRDIRAYLRHIHK
jgi:hypothetical protein